MQTSEEHAHHKSKSEAAFRRIISEFPCLVPVDNNMTAFVGFVTISGKEFRVFLTSDCSRFEIEEDLTNILGAKMNAIAERLKSVVDAYEFLVEFRNMAERVVSKESNHRQIVQDGLPPAVFYERLLTELSDIGWDSVAAMEQSMRTLDLKVVDSANRCHVFTLNLPADYPQHPPRCVTNLPRPFQLQWTQVKTLKNVLLQFKREVEKYEDFYRVMEDFDANTCVLEPEHPTWSDTYRRIAFGKHCSARVEIDPRSPIKGFPECRFLGSESAIRPFKQHLNENMHTWDTSGKTLPRENMENVLEVKFPSQEAPDRARDGELSSECGICYVYRLEDRVPDIACDLPECSKPYHRECLLDWLRALPDTRESFGTVTGNCVYCDQTISISVKDV